MRRGSVLVHFGEPGGLFSVVDVSVCWRRRVWVRAGWALWDGWPERRRGGGSFVVVSGTRLSKSDREGVSFGKLLGRGSRNGHVNSGLATRFPLARRDPGKSPTD